MSKNFITTDLYESYIHHRLNESQAPIFHDTKTDKYYRYDPVERKYVELNGKGPIIDGPTTQGNVNNTEPGHGDSPDITSRGKTADKQGADSKDKYSEFNGDIDSLRDDLWKAKQKDYDKLKADLDAEDEERRAYGVYKKVFMSPERVRQIKDAFKDVDKITNGTEKETIQIQKDIDDAEFKRQQAISLKTVERNDSTVEEFEESIKRFLASLDTVETENQAEYTYSRINKNYASSDIIKKGRRHRELPLPTPKPTIVLYCDVSGSVSAASQRLEKDIAGMMKKYQDEGKLEFVAKQWASNLVLWGQDGAGGGTETKKVFEDIAVMNSKVKNLNVIIVTDNDTQQAGAWPAVNIPGHAWEVFVANSDNYAVKQKLYAKKGVEVFHLKDV